MQFPPDAAALLDAVATLLETDVLPVVPTDLQHRVRVAAHLTRLLEREWRLGPAAAGRERAALEALVDAPAGSTTEGLATALADRLRAEDDPDALARAWSALVEIARDDLTIAKPGHEAWDGG